LYNIAFVRTPVILVGLVHAKNLLGGHRLIMDFGDGPFEMSPSIGIAVLSLILTFFTSFFFQPSSPQQRRDGHEREGLRNF
jgi:hypothetical protein